MLSIFWGVYEVPFHILDILEDVLPCILTDFLLDLITDLSLKLFVQKYFRFSSALRDKEYFCRDMAKYGYLDMLEWGINNFKYLLNFEDIIIEAAVNGNIHILDSLYYENDRLFVKDASYIFIESIEKGQYESVKWMYDHDIEISKENIKESMYKAFFSKNIELIEFIYSKFLKHQFNLNMLDISRIASYATLEIMNWLYEKGFVPTDQMFNIYVKNGRIDLLEWCYGKGLRPNVETYKIAIECNETNILKWIYEKNIPLNNELFNYAIESSNGNVEILDFMYKHGCRFNNQTYEFLEDALINPRKMEWILEHGFMLMLKMQNGL